MLQKSPCSRTSFGPMSTSCSLREKQPILVGGGVNSENFAEVAGVADGVIVSSALKDSGAAFGRFVPGRVSAFMEEARRVRAMK